MEDEPPHVDWDADKAAKEGRPRKRLDLSLELGCQVLIVEVDEDQRSGYSCENKRIMELSQDSQHRSIVFIRFNLDEYTNQDSICVKSCWKLNELGVMRITETNQKEGNQEEEQEIEGQPLV